MENSIDRLYFHLVPRDVDEEMSVLDFLYSSGEDFMRTAGEDVESFLNLIPRGSKRNGVVKRLDINQRRGDYEISDSPLNLRLKFDPSFRCYFGNNIFMDLPLFRLRVGATDQGLAEFVTRAAVEHFFLYQSTLSPNTIAVFGHFESRTRLRGRPVLKRYLASGLRIRTRSYFKGENHSIDYIV